MALWEQDLAETLERRLERFLYHSRWLLAPFYVGPVSSLVVLGFAFLKELFDLFYKLFDSALNLSGGQVGDWPDTAILGVLTLIDLSLAGNLLLIVIFSGYENFVSRIDTGSSKDGRSGWAISTLPA